MKVKTVIGAIITAVVSAVVYEVSVIGGRALSSDMKYLKECKSDGRRVKGGKK